MKTTNIATLLVALVALSACGPTSKQLQTESDTLTTWARCIGTEMRTAAAQYDDEYMCVEIALAMCDRQKNVYIAAKSVTDGPGSAHRVVELFEIKARQTGPALAKAMMIKAERQANAPWPVPMEIR